MLNILSLGAGVQSTAVLLMSEVGELPPLDGAIFANPGWEPASVYRHLKWLKKTCRTPIHVVSCGRNIRKDAVIAQVRGTLSKGQRFASMPLYTRKLWTADTLPELRAAIAELMDKKQAAGDEDWQPSRLLEIMRRVERGEDVEQLGMIRRQCTREYKIEPIQAELRRMLGYRKGQRIACPDGPLVRQWFGISFDEWQRQKSPDHKWTEHYYPLVDRRMTRQSCLDWILDRGFPRPPRSACVGCPFHSDAEWRDMKENRPHEWADACEVDLAIRDCGGMRGQVFLHRNCHPLAEIDFSTADERSGQLNLFMDECGV